MLQAETSGALGTEILNTLRAMLLPMRGLYGLRATQIYRNSGGLIKGGKVNIHAQTNCNRIYNAELKINSNIWFTAFQSGTNNPLVPKQTAAELAHMEVIAYRSKHPFPWFAVESGKPTCDRSCPEECKVAYVKPV